MGNCAAASKRQETALKFDLSVGNMAGDHRGSSFLQSPCKGSESAIPVSRPELNVKEETFFDSQPWLDSDCEDFFSVCNETPSLGNSPIHSKNYRELPQLEKSLPTVVALDSVTKPPVAELKKLHELFQESFRGNPDDENILGDGEFPLDIPSKSPYSPVTISDQSPTPMKKVKSAQSLPCCIPSLVRNISFGERKRRMKSANGRVLQPNEMEGKA